MQYETVKYLSLPSVGGVISSDMSRAIAARSRAPGTEIHAVTVQC